MRRRLGTAATGTLLALGLAACESGPTPGTLVVELRDARSTTGAARAVRFRLVGEQSGITAPAGSGILVVSAPTAGDTVIVAAFAAAGDSLNESVVARVSVPDVGAASRYRVTVLEVAAPGPAYGLQVPALYTLAVVRP